MIADEDIRRVKQHIRSALKDQRARGVDTSLLTDFLRMANEVSSLKGAIRMHVARTRDALNHKCNDDRTSALDAANQLLWKEASE